MGRIIVTLLLFTPFFLFAQYPSTGNKQRLGWQTTGDGLIWRGVAADTVNKPNNRNYPYFQLDTVNAVLYRFIQTKQQWQPVTGGADVDSLIYATRYWVNSNFFPLAGGTLTGTGGSGFVGFPAQSVPPATPSGGVNLYSNSSSQLSWLPPDGFFRTLISPTPLVPRQYTFMNRSYTLADSADVAALPTGSGTTNYYAKWSSGTALGVGNLFDNNTYVGILNSKPFALGQWTTAGRPTGVQGYMGYNTTLNGLDWYNGTRWATGLESTFARGTATRVPFFDANGQVTDNSSLTFTSGTGQLMATRYSFNGATGINFVPFGSTELALSMPTNSAFTLFADGGDFIPFYTNQDLGSINRSWSTTYTNNIIFSSAGTASSPSIRYRIVGNNIPTGMYFVGNLANHDLGFSTNSAARLYITYSGLVGVGITTPSRTLHVEGEARISDLTTDTPTRIVGADADGDLGAITVSTGLSLSAGSLTAQNIGNANLTLTSNRTLSGGGFDLRLDTDVTIGDSLKVVGLADHTDPDSIVTTKAGWLGKRKWMMPSANLYDGTSSGYFFDNGAIGFQISSASGYSYQYQDWNTIDNYSYHNDGGYHGFYSNFFGTQGTVYLQATRSFNGNLGTNLIMRPDYFAFYNGSSQNLIKVDSSGTVEFPFYGTGANEASDLSKTQSNYIAGFATDGTVLDLERKRDTTIYVTDADYNFASALTSAQILARYNNIIIYSKLTASATSDNQIILHSASSDFLQCTIQIYSNDASADADATSIDFTTNGAVDGAGGTVSTYGMVGGEKITIRAVNDSGYKWIFN